MTCIMMQSKCRGMTTVCQQTLLNFFVLSELPGKPFKNPDVYSIKKFC